MLGSITSSFAFGNDVGASWVTEARWNGGAKIALKKRATDLLPLLEVVV